jgi:hypothetical protein
MYVMWYVLLLLLLKHLLICECEYVICYVYVVYVMWYVMLLLPLKHMWYVKVCICVYTCAHQFVCVRQRECMRVCVCMYVCACACLSPQVAGSLEWAALLLQERCEILLRQ